MKKGFFIFLLGVTLSVVFMNFQTASNSYKPEGGYIDVYFENKCSKDVTLKIQADGSSSSGTLYAGKKERKPVKAGYKIYANDKLVAEIEDSDSGKTIVVCD